MYRYALHHDSDTCECCNDSSSHYEEPDDVDLDFVTHNSKQEDGDRAFSESNTGDSGDLAEYLPLNRFEICERISYFRKESSEPVSRCDVGKSGVNDVDNL